ncbi:MULTISPECIES: carbohydrate ABC transporter permease [unclassified Streptomyces]|uniref:carbohydrate ABC transporter permease n=1 Tax=unclassified Streptomyces TaxID=2593676 RepID=UPI002DD92590|nr:MULTISPECIES: carbohydrate ABC transporter permease [unclassified Streptomyces]WSA94410.1 carbohydrate ABC transporter permease [Streptomyces sp. NBC_01795]WSB78828.1 carbohydrate ABC transporter permease [Streptomyces sp. NBC_01775]WSS12969.1 carbohydrate ABC transporter permease [Streptomyces sp. NBC_01186]WSS41752.1 carbohydrate ABC transporter permease [Streptomyces sp. NBC_01187]
MTTVTAKGGSSETPAPAPASAGARPKTPLAARVASATGHWAVRFALVVIGLFWLMPTAGLLSSSLRDPAEISISGWWKIFDFNGSFPWIIDSGQLTWSNYDALFANEQVMDSLLTTVLITVPATALVVIFGALAGYAFAWMDFPGRDWWFMGVVGLLVVPVQVALIPVAKLFGTLGLFETTPGVILFHTAFGLPFAIFLLRNFFAEIPRELLEAARLDGAGEIRLFTRVILPLGGPAIASLGIFQFLWVWNDMLVALIFADSTNPPVTVALQQQVRQFGNNIDVLAPGAFISMLVPLAVFFAFQKQFVSGVMAGAVK